MATMADIARVAGVSTATVSHVLNGTKAVRDGTRGRVLQAAADLHYAPNSVASSLARGRTTTLGLVLSAISNPYFGELLHAAEAEATAAGYTLLVVDPREDPDHELTVVSRLHRHRVDGVVIAPSARPAAALDLLRARGVPSVVIDRLVDPTRDQVGSENRAATAGLVEHLADLGHTRVALVAGLRGLSTTEERLAGHRDALAARGLDPDPALVLAGESATGTARRVVHRMLEAPHPPTGIVVGNNSMTVGALQALREAGVRVGRDVAVVAFDDFAWADLLVPRLTTVAQPFAEIATRAVRMLLARMADPDAPTETVRLTPTFVHRESCGCDPPEGLRPP